MSELLEFAARLIELEGGAVEATGSEVRALLPEALAARWHARDELVLSEAEDAAQRLAYGGELLERMIETATSNVSVAGARLALPAVRASQVRSAAERFTLRNGLVTVGEVRLGVQTRFELFTLATLHGDEKRELLISSVISAASATEVPGFGEAIAGIVPDEAGAPLAPPERVLEAALRRCALKAEAAAQGFREGMTRRFERDRERIEAYFVDLQAELRKRARKGKLDPAAVDDKRTALLADRTNKLEALSARFVLRVEVMPIALRTLELEGGFASVTLQRRKARRTLDLEFDGATRKLVAPRCDACSCSASRPAACDDALHLLCETCAPRAEGRVACAACRGGVKVGAMGGRVW